MVETPVGQKCLSCGRVEFKSPQGTGRRYAAGGAGLLTAALLQVLLSMIPLGILALVIPLVVGYLTGTAVRALGGRNFGLGPTAAVAAPCGMALGMLFLGFPLGGLFRLGFLFSAGIAAYVAHYRASH
jgi:hypothetical protein